MSTRRTAYFNNNAFDELGLIITDTVVPPASHIKYRSVSIPDGPVIFEETGQRDPVSFPIKCTVTEPDKLRSIYAMAAEPGILILPDEPDKYYYGVLTIATPKNIILYYNKITFTMTAEPYAYAVNNSQVTCSFTEHSWYKSADITNSGTADAEPIYEVTTPGGGNFDIWVDSNGQRVALCRVLVDAADVIRIDVAGRKISNSAGDIINNKAQHDFSKLVLKPGINTVSISNCTQLKIVKNERWY